MCYLTCVARIVAVLSMVVLGASAVCAPALSAAPIVTIRAATEHPDPTDCNNVVLAEFAKLVEEASGGKMKVSLYLGTVGGAKEILNAQLLGSTEVSSMEKSLLTGLVREVGALGLPFIMTSREQALRVLRDSSVQETLGSKLAAKGIQTLGWFVQSGRGLASNKPVRKLSDMAGLKVRVMDDPVMIAQYKALGASPVPVAWTETYLALKQGIVDACDTTIPHGFTAKLNEVCKYLIMLESSYSIAGIYASKKWFDGLTADQRKIVSEAGKAGVQVWDTGELKLYDKALAGWQKTIEIIRPDLSEFRKAGQTIYPAFDNLYGREIIDEIMKQGKK